MLSPPFFRPLCYLILNHWTKSNQIWCLSYSHDLGLQQQNRFCLAPWGTGEWSSEWSKRQISLNFNNTVNFIFLYQSLRVFLQHIKQDFCFDAWVIPKRWDVWGGGGGDWGRRGGGGKIRTWSSDISSWRG